jgi:hypothetical protein
MTREEAEAFLESITMKGSGIAVGCNFVAEVETAPVQIKLAPPLYQKQEIFEIVSSSIKLFVNISQPWTIGYHRRADVEAVCAQLREHVNKVCEALIATAESVKSA